MIRALLKYSSAVTIVFDGDSPVAKADERLKRTTAKTKAKLKFDNTRQQLKGHKHTKPEKKRLRQLAQNADYITHEDKTKCFQVIQQTFNNVCKVVQADGEADYVCALLAQESDTAVIIGNDTDYIALSCKMSSSTTIRGA